MTLIVTAATRNFVTQVSDRRLTCDNGQLFDDDANKAVILEFKDGVLSFAYTGVGFIDGTRTDEWITHLLTDHGTPEMTAKEAVARLASVTTDEFARLSRHMAESRLSIAVAGWPKKRRLPPYVGLISNFEDFDQASSPSSTAIIPARHLPRARSQFSVHGGTANTNDKKAACVMINGRESAVARPRKQTNKLREFIEDNFDPGIVTRKLVAFIRRCADHPTEGKYIGRNCMAVFLSDEGRICWYYPEDSSRPVSFAPNLVGPMFTMKDAIVSRKRLTRREMERWKRKGEKGKPDV